jgi:hypothetical protein
MLWPQFKKLIIMGGFVPTYESDASYNPNDIIFGGDGELYQALNPLDANNDPIPNVNKDPENTMNNSFWAMFQPNFGS